MIRHLAILTAGAALIVVLALAVERPWVSDGDEAVTEFQLPSPIAAMDSRLVDQNEQLVTPSDLLGNPSIVFFGFTYCPDVCPTMLTTISSWLQQLGDNAERFNVPKVRATRLSLITMDNAISNDAAAATVPGPYALLRIIAIPPAEGKAFDIFT